ncbi:uncharacterized protein DFL_002243 [Arthrobotrys flagrans]|uniref:F-box domain-containing protein n=1 Tax=Arthrobotrys flagrans TaxID=97331 RepID=A0A437A9X5_ARTFL|nr:hypothetical protein DFL_002243 [Arthrobotrys flagrans]
MAPETKINLSTLPYDLIYDICEYLSNDDVQSLRLVSTPISSNIPPARLEEIQSQRTIFKHPYEMTRLKRLASLPLEKRSRIKHVIIDLADPYVVPISSHEFDGLIQGYSERTRLKLLKLYLDYRDRNPHGFGSRYTRTFRRLAERVLRNTSSTSDQAEQDSETKSESSSLSFTTRSEIYSMLSESFAFNADSQLSKFRKAKEKQEEGFDFFKSLIEAFKLLPNLKIISFKDRSRHEQNKDYISTVWKTFNPALATFLKKNPEMNSLPWHDWFQNNPNYAYGLTLARAYPGVLFCAAHARCQISEIRMDGLGWNRSIDSVPLWKFGRWYQANDGLTFRPCVPREGHDPVDVEAFKYTYGNLSRLEICVAFDWTVEYRDEKEVSELFMTVIRNARALVITRILGVSAEQCKPSFVFPQMAVLPNLRSLELIKAGVTMLALTEFLLANKRSLKEVFCVLTVRHIVRREDMISFLQKVREQLDLRVFTMDFLTNKEPTKNCHLSVDIRGSWRDDTGGYDRYRVGTKCEQGRFWGWYSAQDRELLPRSDWVTKTSWEGFIEGIEEMDTGESCLDHWNGNMKDHD